MLSARFWQAAVTCCSSSFNAPCKISSSARFLKKVVSLMSSRSVGFRFFMVFLTGQSYKDKLFCRWLPVLNKKATGLGSFFVMDFLGPGYLSYLFFTLSPWPSIFSFSSVDFILLLLLFFISASALRWC